MSREKITEFRWNSLLFIAGWVNAAAFLACASFVTHLTGVSTLLGVSIAQRDWIKAIESASIPFCFLLGAVLAGYKMRQHRHRSLEGRFHKMIQLLGILLFMIALGGHFNWFEGVASAVGLKEVIPSVALLAFVSGLQNGTVTAFSEGSTRVTHLTGLVTDLGLGISYMFLAEENSEKKRKEIETLKKRIVFFFLFVLGALMGSVVYSKFGDLNYLVPSILCFTLMHLSREILPEKDRNRIFDAAAIQQGAIQKASS